MKDAQSQVQYIRRQPVIRSLKKVDLKSTIYDHNLNLSQKFSQIQALTNIDISMDISPSINNTSFPRPSNLNVPQRSLVLDRNSVKHMSSSELLGDKNLKIAKSADSRTRLGIFRKQTLNLDSRLNNPRRGRVCSVLLSIEECYDHRGFVSPKMGSRNQRLKVFRCSTLSLSKLVPPE